MGTVTFDTHEFIKSLESAGFEESQAEALAAQLKKVQEGSVASLATKQDLKELELRVENKLESMRGEITLLKWMMGFVLAGVVSLVLKAFFLQ